jgi:hypothetical protein
VREDKHTRGPLRRCGQDQGGCICRAIWSTTADRPIAIVEQKPEDWSPLSDEEADDNCRLVAAAYSSYDKHCGKYAVQCAEEDLLGEALEACKLARNTIANHRIPQTAADAAIQIHLQLGPCLEKLNAVLAKTGGASYV